jgi:hypothetical protein
MTARQAQEETDQRTRWAEEAAAALTRLEPSDQDRAEALEALLRLLPRAGSSAQAIARVFVGLTKTAEEQTQARVALLGLMVSSVPPTQELLKIWAALGVTTEERLQMREAFVGLLTSTRTPSWSYLLPGVLAGLDPTTSDLEGWQSWTVPPNSELLAAIRKNSTVSAWLATLSSLPTLNPHLRSLTTGNR